MAEFADTASAAEAHLQAGLAAEPQAEPEPQTQAAEPEPAQQDAAQPETFDGFEMDWDGERKRFPRDQIEFLARLGADEFIRRQQRTQPQPQGQQQAQPAPTAQPQAQAADPQAKLVERLETLEKRLASAETEREQARLQGQIANIQSQLENTFSAQDLYKEFEKPEHRDIFRQQAISLLYANPNMSPDTAVKMVVERFTEMFKAREAKYVQSKIKQAQNRVETGGSPSAMSQGPIGAKGFKTGELASAAESRIRQMFQEASK